MKFKYLLFFFKKIKLNFFFQKKLKMVTFYSLVLPLIETSIILTIIPFISNFFKYEKNPYVENIFSILLVNDENNIYFRILIILSLLVLFYLMLIITERKIINLSYEFFSKTKTFTLKYILNQSFKNIFKTDVANQVQVISNEINIIVTGVFAYSSIIKAIFLFILFSSILLIINFKITLIILFFLIFLNLLLFFFFKEKFSYYGKRDLETSLKSNSIIYNFIVNIFSIKQYSLEDKAIALSNDSFEDLKKIRADYLFTQKFIKLILELIIFSILLIFLIYVVTDKNYLNNNMTYLSVLFYGIFRLFPLFNQFNTNFATLIKLAKASKNLINTLKQLKQDRTKKIKYSNHKIKKNIIYLNNYNILINKKKLIVNSNLTLSSKNIYFLKGENGSGKSSFLKSLLNLNNYSGKIYYDNIDLKKIDINKLLKIAKYCPQNDIIFNNSVAYNILLDKQNNKNLKLLNEVLKLTQLEKFSKNKNIFTYNIGENGSKISGGEKQKILIARALYSKPNFLFLDESFSNVSKEDTQKILNKLKKFLPNSIIIIITHQITNFKNFKTINIENKKIFIE